MAHIVAGVCGLEVLLEITNDGSMDALELGRARWRSRRGMLELDLLLTTFVEVEFETLDESLRQLYLDLLGLDDFEIWDWLQGVATPPDEFGALIERIKLLNAERSPHE